MRSRSALATAITVGALTLATTSQSASAGSRPEGGRAVVGGFHHLVVIYEENHSFDNLFGMWGSVAGQKVDGVASAPASRTTQRAQNGDAYGCLLQNDVNLASPPLANTCSDSAHGVPASSFGNAPFVIDSYIPASATTCPKPGVFAPNGVLNGTGLPGGCTRDLVHRFYQEQYQIDGGKQDRYVTGSDAVGLSMGVYDTKKLPIWQYLHSAGAPNYVITDRLFQGAFGGSFLNHQYLIAARAPVDTSGGADGAVHSIVDSNGFPNTSPTYPLYTSTGTVLDRQLTQACGVAADPAVACGDYAVNTIQPASWPHAPGVQLPLIDDTTYPNIGDRMSAAGVSWAWYSGGWDNANGNVSGLGWTNGSTAGTCADPNHASSAVYPNCVDALFQYHHQPFNYFAAYAPGQPGRAHLRDEADLTAAASAGTLPTVSFVKPVGEENEHPGYASESGGSTHLVELLKSLTTGPQAKDTLVLVTYDEFGGQWDHVSPPGTGTTHGVHDLFGPGTRIPGFVVSAGLRHSGVDHTVYDTTSILATIERGLRLPPLTSRDAKVADLRHVVVH